VLELADMFLLLFYQDSVQDSASLIRYLCEHSRASGMVCTGIDACQSDDFNLQNMVDFSCNVAVDGKGSCYFKRPFLDLLILFLVSDTFLILNTSKLKVRP
jgi:hypothetical protein